MKPIETRGPVTRPHTPTRTRSPEHPDARSSVFDIRHQLNANYRRVAAILQRIEQNDDNPSVQIAAAAELRQHISLAKKSLDNILKQEALQDVTRDIIAALESFGPSKRRKAIDTLNETLNNLDPG